MAKELNLVNLEKAVEEMHEKNYGVTAVKERGKHPMYLKLSDVAIKLGFNAQSAEDFIRRELKGKMPLSKDTEL